MRNIIILIVLILGVMLNCSKPFIRVPVVNAMPQKFMEIMKGGKSVAIIKKVNPALKFRHENQQKTALDAIENQLNQARYFSLIDIESRSERLREIAYTQTGATSAETEIGKEFNLHGLIYLSAEQPPKYECETKEVTEKKMICPEGEDKAVCMVEKVEKTFVYVKKIAKYTLFLNARLVNIETGQSLGFSETSPSLLERKKLKNEISPDEDFTCASESETFQAALNKSSANLARQISPTVIDMEIVISDEVTGVAKENRKETEKLLELGNEWALNGNFEQAQKSWENALEKSNRLSVAAFWNLAVLYWAAADLEKAETYFKNAIDNPDFTSSYRMKIYSKFKSEKERIQKEQSRNPGS